MTPTRRKILYAVSFETLGIAIAALGLIVMAGADAGSSIILSAITATVALSWSFVFNNLFEAWEARQKIRGRSFRRRTVHALLFEGGLVLLLVPIMAWWLNVSLMQALAYEAGLIALFMAYTYAFTWAFDQIFGLPVSAR
jgi:uncharacterized membrane protein